MTDDSQKFLSAIEQLTEKVDAEIGAGKIKMSIRTQRIASYITAYDDKMPGLLAFFKSQNQNGDEPAPVATTVLEEVKELPTAAPQGEVPALALEWIQNMLKENKSLKEDQLLDIYWTNHNSGLADHFDGEQKTSEILFLCLSSVAGILRSPTFSLTFIPIAVGQAFSFQGRITKGTMTMQGERWSNSAFGYAVEDGEKMWAEITGWDKEAAESIEKLEAWSTYTGDFTGKKQNNKFSLSLNGPTEFEKVGEVELSNEWNNCLELFNRTRPDVVDITSITLDSVAPNDDQIKKAKKSGKPAKGGSIFTFRARVSRIFEEKTTKDGQPFVGVALITADPTKLTSVDPFSMTFWRDDCADFLSTMTPNSTILVHAWATEGKEDFKGTISFNVKWWLPVTIAKQVEIKAPQPQAYTGA